MPSVLRIAMWSGPRNLSSALMRSFGRRADCAVRDEPFYGAYLAATGLDHPLRAEILAATETDWRRVALRCAGEDPGRPVLYQKHMTHHMLPEFDLGWTRQVTNAFLIRAPERVLASYARKREAPGRAEIGFDAQAALFDRECDRLGRAPPVIDAEDVSAAPEAALRALCAALGLSFDPAMLSWPAGRQPDDGVWGAHWYDALWRSTGFGSPGEPGLPELPPALARIAEAVRPAYERLRAHRLGPAA
jgi:hypothetical protein